MFTASKFVTAIMTAPAPAKRYLVDALTDTEDPFAHLVNLTPFKFRLP